MSETKPIPGWAYMIVGLAIMGYTKFIQSRTPASKIGLFFWVGLAFLTFGLLREFVPRLMAKKVKKDPAGPPQQASHLQAHPHKFNQSPHVTHPHLQPQQHPSHPYQPQHKQCPRCHQLTHGQGKFCHNCGHQFF
jgi:hypothetical protein